MRNQASSLSRLWLLLPLVLTCLFMTAVQGSGNGSGSDLHIVNSKENSAMEHLFHEWREEFGIQYKTVKEFAERMQVWFQNHGTFMLFCCCCCCCCFQQQKNNRPTVGLWIDVTMMTMMLSSYSSRVLGVRRTQSCNTAWPLHHSPLHSPSTYSQHNTGLLRSLYRTSQQPGSSSFLSTWTQSVF